MMIIDVIENNEMRKNKMKPEQVIDEYLKNTLKSKYSGYISGKTMNRLMKNKE